MDSILKLILVIAVAAGLITACASPTPALIIKVNSVDDIPDINTLYKSEIERLELDMSAGQVLALFPNIEQECYPNGDICHFTVFDERLVQIDKRLGDVNLLTGTLFTLLALTCVISDDDCPEAVVAALNVLTASSFEKRKIKTSVNKDGIITLVQWINIELERGKVKQWAINEPLSQFRPKTYTNELPPLEEALKPSQN